ncbi:UbiA family prenyltransferase [Streptomyces sp. ISL-10]|nr:UbiA family prenyltransferase [Streptomyces sp. ISL-10]
MPSSTPGAVGAPARPPGHATLRAWAELLRVSALFTVPGDALAGAAAAGLRPNRGTALAVCASLCLYEAGMALNDWTDREEDAVDRPHRPLPSGRITPAAALTAAGALTTAGLALASRAGRPALAVATALSATVWAYDLRLKHTKAGPAAMATARGLDLLLGATATLSAMPPAGAPPAAPGREVSGLSAMPPARGLSTGSVTGPRPTAPGREATRSGRNASRPPARPAHRGAAVGAPPPGTDAARPRGASGAARFGDHAPGALRAAAASPGALARGVRRVAAAGGLGAEPPGFRGGLSASAAAGRAADPVSPDAVRVTAAAASPGALARGVRRVAAAGGSGAEPPGSRQGFGEGWGGGFSAPARAAAALAAHTYAVTAVSRHEAHGGSTLTPLAALAATAVLGAVVAHPRHRPGESGATIRRAVSAAAPVLLAAAYLRTAATPYLHAALNPSPPLTQRAVGGGIRAVIPLQAALAARSGANVTALAVMGLVPIARRLARKVSPT